MPSDINFSNKTILKRYVEDNICIINDRISSFNPGRLAEDVDFDETDIKNYLKDKLYMELPNKSSEIIDKFRRHSYQKNKIVEIANEMIYYKSDLQNAITTILFKELSTSVTEDLDDNLMNAILENAGFSEEKKRYIKKDLGRILKKALTVVLGNGFSSNINNTESGVQTANAGDSAQLIFVGRAILAGYNCSNVDVRSSRYDAIIDYKDHLFKVQVKGISGNTISFKDRDRGGRGIDTHNPRNIGKRITSDDCDIYVAVDKQVGTCYIIPMKNIDTLSDEEINSVNIGTLCQYLENWQIIEELFTEVFELSHNNL